MTQAKRELEHTEKHAECGDVVRLRFPNDEYANVTVIAKTDERLVVAEDGLVLEFERVLVPFDLKGTTLGNVCGTLKMWQAVNFPDSPPAMIVENLGKPN